MLESRCRDLLLLWPSKTSFVCKFPRLLNLPPTNVERSASSVGLWPPSMRASFWFHLGSSPGSCKLTVTWFKESSKAECFPFAEILRAEKGVKGRQRVGHECKGHDKWPCWRHFRHLAGYIMDRTSILHREALVGMCVCVCVCVCVCNIRVYIYVCVCVYTHICTYFSDENTDAHT